MGRTLYFSAAVGIFVALSATAQSVSQLPPVAPFRIEPGTSFSASAERQVLENASEKRSAAAGRILTDFDAALQVIRNNHVAGRTLRTDALTRSSIDGMLSELDPHSSFYDPGEFRALLSDQNSEYSGTGISISNFVENGRIETFVMATQPGSSAERAKLRYGDRIVSVDGVGVVGLTVDLVRDRVRGTRGTTVRMVVERADGRYLETIDLKRDRVVQPSVPAYFMLREDTGYIDLTEGFSHTTSAELDTALTDLAGRGMKALVLDMRNNSGGILEEAVRVAEKFLPAGRMIISQRGRSVLDNLTWTSKNRDPLDVPLVVLVNGQTASASEVVAGALQDNDRALILGQNTFGKSLVQTVLGLPGGAGLTLTTGRYYTPSGRSVQRSYSDSGIYDYFHHRQAGDSSTARLSARTLTNREVFGGAGITPDVKTGTEQFDLKRATLIDPIFFFVREMIRSKTSRSSAATGSYSPDEITKTYLPLFRGFAQNQVWNVSALTLETEATYIAGQIGYQLALADRGPRAASRMRIESDPQIDSAITALPRASELADAARRISRPAEKKKPAGSHPRAGQGRNRRN